MRITAIASKDRRQPRARRGYTLVDVTISVLIIGILAAVAVPKFAGSMHRNQAEAAAHRVRADLLLARQTSIAQSVALTVAIDVSGNNYSITGIADLDHPLATYAVTISDSPYQASIDSSIFNGSPDVTFDRYGKPVDGGTITVSAQGYIQTVTVDSETGRVTVP